MSKLLLHPVVQKRIDNFVSNPSHSVCIIGPIGAGKGFLAQQIAEKLINDQLKSAIKVIKPEKNSLGIDAIRDLQHFLKLKVPGKATVRRVVIIEDSEQMTPEAQNALLKTLEEPASDTVIVLTCSNWQKLLPTIKSRTTGLHLQSPSLEETVKFFKDYKPAEVAKVFHMTGGSTGLIHAVLSEEDHPLLEAINASKQILTNNPYERLISVDEWSKDKQALKNLLFGLKRILAMTLTTKGQISKKSVQGLEAVYKAEVAGEGSPNLKLLLTDLFLNL